MQVLFVSAACQGMLQVVAHVKSLLHADCFVSTTVLQQVNLAELDVQMVQLAQKQRALHAALAEKDALQDRLTEVVQPIGLFLVLSARFCISIITAPLFKSHVSSVAHGHITLANKHVSASTTRHPSSVSTSGV